MFPFLFVSSWFKARFGLFAGLPSPSGDTSATPRSLRLLLVFRCLILRRATTCATTMIAADFCCVTSVIAGRRAVSVAERCCPVRSPMMRDSPHRRWLIGTGSTRPPFVQLPLPLARQISPGKNAMFPCTSAAFTLSAASDGLRHVVLARPQTRLTFRACCDAITHEFPVG